MLGSGRKGTLSLSRGRPRVVAPPIEVVYLDSEEEQPVVVYSGCKDPAQVEIIDITQEMDNVRIVPKGRTRSGYKAPETSEILTDEKFKFPLFQDFLQLSKDEQNNVGKAFSRRLDEILAEKERRKEEAARTAQQAKEQKKATAAAGKQQAADALLAGALSSCGRRTTRLSSGALKRSDFKGLTYSPTSSLSPVAVSGTPKLSRCIPQPRRSSAKQGDGDEDTSKKITESCIDCQSSVSTPSSSLQQNGEVALAEKISCGAKQSSPLIPQSPAAASLLDEASTNSSISVRKHGDDKTVSQCPLDDDTGWVENDEWLVEKIVDSKIERNEKDNSEKKMYRVKWKGWDERFNEWVSEEDVGQSLIKTYWRGIVKRIKFYNLQIRKLARFHDAESLSYFLLDDY